VTTVIVDSHIHLHELPHHMISKYCNNGEFVLLAVSDDIMSSEKTIGLSSECGNVVAAVGIHPWKIKIGISPEELRRLEDLAGRVRFLGEVGLDKRFVPETFDAQLTFFRKVLSLAERRGMGLSIHAAGAWREVLDELTSYRIRAAAIHWFTGPHTLLKEIVDRGYYIGVNVALKIQRKARLIVEKAPIDILLTESDAPYNYRGLTLTPDEIPAVLRIISDLKGVKVDEVTEAILKNFSRFLGKAGSPLPGSLEWTTLN
jgi:TatD DNase family protein